MYMDMDIKIDCIGLFFINFYKVDSVIRDSNFCCDDLFMGVVFFKGG